MSEAGKDVIYVDVDDEITGIIDKLQGSQHKIVALVLPKRATMMQSTVNMRLLKRSAQSAHKNVVLITSESNLLPLAGAVGIHVAKSLQSKPVIPPLPARDDKPEVINSDEDHLDSSKSIGELAGLPDGSEKEETIQVDNDDELSSAGAAAGAITDKINKKMKKFKIPNFDKFRTRLFLIGAGGLLLIVFWFWAFIIAPKAKVIIKTDTTTASAFADFTAKTDATTLDLTTNTLPAELKSVKKSSTETVPATGEKNVGEKATGTMTVYNCTDDTVTLPAGTKFTNNGLAFTTNTAVSVPNSDFFSNGNCKKNQKADVAVTAAAPGDQYNLSGGREYLSNFSSTLTGVGSAMTGGTNKIIKVVSDADVEAANQKASASNTNITEELRALMAQSQMVGINDTLSNDAPVVNATPAVGQEAGEVTVTIEISYTMVGVKETDLKMLIEQSVAPTIDINRQKVLDAGIKDAIFRVINKSATDYKINLQTLVVIGPNLDEAEIKKEILGKKRGNAENLIASRPGVKEVRISYSPFWVLSTPKAAKKITIVLEQTNNAPPQ